MIGSARLSNLAPFVSYEYLLDDPKTMTGFEIQCRNRLTFLHLYEICGK